MPSISRAQSEAETEALRGAIQHAEKAREGQALILELRPAVAHPCAHHAFDVPGLWDEIAQEYRRIGDFDAAIEARERSIAAGYRSWPDPRADIAEFHLLAGRADEAAKLYEKLRAGHPEDIWLYNHAGYAHAGVGDHENAVAWLTAGIDVGLASGDPEGVVDQLNDLRSASLAALGRGPDELTERAAGFVKSWTRPAAGTWRAPSAPGGEPRAERACEHCGFDPGVESARSPRIGGRTERPAPPPVELSVAWFPESDWTRALERWPDLTDRFAGHAELRRPEYAGPGVAGPPGSLLQSQLMLLEQGEREAGLVPEPAVEGALAHPGLSKARIRGEPPRNSPSGSSVGSGIRREGARMSTRAREVDSVALPPTGTWELDPAHTSVEVVARHILTKVRGRFASFSGTIQIAEKPEDSNTEVEIDAASIQTGVEMRDNHLRSDDFFAVERFPKIRFKSTELRPVGGTAFQLVGHLTVRDITRPVTLDVEFLGWWDDPMTDKRASFTASTEVEREDWDVSWNQVLETGGLLVGKRVRLEIEVEVVRTRDAE